MKTIGELVQSVDYALAFRRLEPVADAPRRLLLLLHGWGSDERQLASAGAGVDGATVTVLPRGPRSAGEDGFGWYRVAFDGGEPQAFVEEMQDSCTRLIAFVDQLQSHHDIEPSRTVIAGFSQGGVLAAQIALTAPERVAGFAMASARILPGAEQDFAHRDALSPLRALIVHGRGDTTLPPEHAEHSAETLQRLGIMHASLLHDAGHVPTKAMQADVARWFNDPRQPWNA